MLSEVLIKYIGKPVSPPYIVERVGGRFAELARMGGKIKLSVFFYLCLIPLMMECAGATLPGGAPLEPTEPDTRSKAMVAGIHRFLDAKIIEAGKRRERYWQRDITSAAAYERSVKGNRERLSRMLGVIAEDKRTPFTALNLCCTTAHDATLATSGQLTIQAVEWPVLREIKGEGLLLRPKGEIRGYAIVVPDADQTPEMAAGLVSGIAAESCAALRLASMGFEVIIPTLLSRECDFSCSEELGIFTDVPHREWIYRMAFTLGRHPVGYELQKIFALVDWAESSGKTQTPVVVAGYGEGGLLALFAAALDTRIKAALVSGYVDCREALWQEPLYRNLFGFLREFNDAEVVSLVAPRTLVVEYAAYPQIAECKPLQDKVRRVAAPGVIRQPSGAVVGSQIARARALVGNAFSERLHYLDGGGGEPPRFFSKHAVDLLVAEFAGDAEKALVAGDIKRTSTPLPDARRRQQRVVREMQNDLQRMLPKVEGERARYIWDKLPLNSLDKYAAATRKYRAAFYEDVIGKFNDPFLPLNVKSCPLPESRDYDIPRDDAYTGYEVTLDVWPEVFVWGYLLVPQGVQPGERRPVVVCQHGLEGLPANCLDTNPKNRASRTYKAMGVELAKRGYVVFSPHNPYRGGTEFRNLQRKLNPLGKSLFSVIAGQHQRILEWLGGHSFVDAGRIGFYGLSYGGKTAMRVPAVLEGYALSICSGDFNDWVRDVVSLERRNCYPFTKEWEISEWNLGRTFNHAEMTALIAPRPFMVERGRKDGCSEDEWVAWEYAKVQRLYDRLGRGGATEIEYFDGPHQINGVGAFDFLDRHLRGGHAR